MPSISSQTNLTIRETLTLLGGVLLFLAFFFAIYAEGTVQLTLFQVCKPKPSFSYHSFLVFLEVYPSESELDYRKL